MKSIIKLGGTLLDNETIELRYGQWISKRMAISADSTAFETRLPLLVLLYSRSSIHMCEYLRNGGWDKLDALSGKNIDIITYHPDELDSETEDSIAERQFELDKVGGDPKPYLATLDLTIKHLPATDIDRQVPPYAHETDFGIDKDSLLFVPIRGHTTQDIGEEISNLIRATTQRTHDLNRNRMRLRGPWDSSINADSIARCWHRELLRTHIATPTANWIFTLFQKWIENKVH